MNMRFYVGIREKRVYNGKTGRFQAWEGDKTCEEGTDNSEKDRPV